MVLQPDVSAAVEDFFRGKQIKMVLPTAPGGSTSLYGFTLAEFMARHIPGRPVIVPEYRPGAGGVVAASYVYNAAPKDGTVITMLLSSMVTTQLMQPETVKFDTVKFTYIGRMADLPRAFISGTPPASTASPTQKRAKCRSARRGRDRAP